MDYFHQVYIKRQWMWHTNARTFVPVCLIYSFQSFIHSGLSHSSYLTWIFRTPSHRSIFFLFFLFHTVCCSVRGDSIFQQSSPKMCSGVLKLGIQTPAYKHTDACVRAIVFCFQLNAMAIYCCLLSCDFHHGVILCMC